MLKLHIKRRFYFRILKKTDKTIFSQIKVLTNRILRGIIVKHNRRNAGVSELADEQDSGSCVPSTYGFKSHRPHQKKRCFRQKTIVSFLFSSLFSSRSSFFSILGVSVCNSKADCKPKSVVCEKKVIIQKSPVR